MTKLKCTNEECEFFNKTEREGGKFLLVAVYSEIHDLELSDTGEVGTDLTEKECETLHKKYTVDNIRCNNCDSEIDFPEKWKKEFHLDDLGEELDNLNPMEKKITC